MAAATEQVIIEFIADYDQLQGAIDTLEKTGQIDKKLADTFKQTSAAITQQAAAIKNTTNSLKAPVKGIEDLDKKTKSFVKNFIDGFGEGVQQALDEAGVSLDEFLNALKNGPQKVTGSTQTLKQELKNLTAQIAEAKVNGTALGDEFNKMVARAGELKDAIADANAEINNAGSDTRNLDNIVGSVSALAGGFSALQGAAALLGDDSEDLQKSLLKVNAAMAVAQGLQQVMNALQKEGSLAKLADIVATKSQIVVQRLYTAVTGNATKATFAFKAALAATGIGAAVLLILTLVDAMKQHNDVLEDTNKLLDKQKTELDDFNDALDVNTRNRISAAKIAGKSEEDLAQITESSIIKQKAKLTEQNTVLAQQRDIIGQNIKRAEEFEKTTGKSVSGVKKATEAYNLLNGQIKENNKELAKLDATQKELNASETERKREDDKKAAEEKKRLDEKAAQDAKAAAEKRRAEEAAIRAAGFEDFKAGVQLQLLEVEKGTEQELALRKKLLNAQLQIDLENEKLTTNQKKLLIQQYFKDRADLEKQFAKDREVATLTAIQNDLQAELNTLNLSAEKRLELQISSIQIAAALEIEAAEGNAAKIAEIESRRDAQVREARVASLRATAEYEASLLSANDGARQRALQKVANDEKQSAEVRINAINQIEQAELQSIQKRMDTNEVLLDNGLISFEDYVLSQAQLLDQQNIVWETAEGKRKDITLKTNEDIKQNMIDTVTTVLDTLQVLGQTMATVFETEAATQNQRIADQKRELEALKEAGAITEKEFITRQKRIEAEEKRAKNQQAQRDKQLAVFNAVLAIPQAYLTGLTQGGPILAAIYAALAAVSAGAIIARPVPKFATGKKGSYEGPGVVGDAGSELVQRSDGSMYVTTKPTMVYLGRKDKIFTAGETKQMLPHVDRSLMRSAEQSSGLDYDKLAEAVMKWYKPQPGTNINIDKEFISESVKDGLSKINYMDRYFSSK